jgi:hypothetical protein
MVDARGHIFQLVCRVSHIFYLVTFTPFLKELISLSATIVLKGKNPVRRMGANTSWSKSICPNTLTGLAVVAEKIFPEIKGRPLQYQRCRQGAMYPKPTMKKSTFLLRSKGYFEKTE